MEDFLRQNVQSLMDYVVSGVDFVVAQAPVIVQQAIQYYTVRNVFVISIVLIAMILMALVPIISYKHQKKHDLHYEFEYDDTTKAFIGIGVGVNLLLLFPLIDAIIELLLIVNAPSLFVLQLAQRLL